LPAAARVRSGGTVMKPMSVIAVGLALLLPAVLAADDKKDDKAAKLLGTWEITKAESPTGENTALRGVTLTFTKDGKLVLAQKNFEGTEFKFEGTYKVEGDKLTYEVKLFNEDVSSTETIKKLTDNELELVSGNVVASLKKKKKKEKDK
jgi:uncharacterized protein (TIGR03066 family)